MLGWGLLRICSSRVGSHSKVGLIRMGAHLRNYSKAGSHRSVTSVAHGECRLLMLVPVKKLIKLLVFREHSTLCKPLDN